MIVYGDPAYDANVRELLAGLRGQLDRARNICDAAWARDLGGYLSRLDAVRSPLIAAGQIEQAICDSNACRASQACIAAMTTRIAEAFTATFANEEGGVASALQRTLGCLDSMPPLRAGSVTVKVPEGFAFYTLYPEQYIQATLDWIRDHADRRQAAPVIVVGIRSIGTSLSALVAATLSRYGWDAHRITLRPGGHPFERHVDIGREEIRGAVYGLVVDEGPGLSGSSMAAAAAALERAGLDRRGIAFLPGHSHEPGHAASPEVRAWWASTPRYSTSPEHMRWNGCSLNDIVMKLTPGLLATDGEVSHTEDFSAGRWRASLFKSPAEWPAVCSAFERTKYRAVCDSGYAALWKFAGFTESCCRARATGLFHGFEVMPWIEGHPLQAEDGEAPMLGHIGRYIARSAGPVMTADQSRAAWMRIENMLYWNTREALGEEDAGAIRAWGQTLKIDHGMPSYTDGHVAPHEWLRTSSGSIVKTDSSGHVTDHTIVGMQPLVWDIAGAIVEWHLNDSSAGCLLEACYAAGVQRVPRDMLRWYEAGYAAMRLGQCEMCSEAEGKQSEEGARLQKAAKLYEERLRRVLHAQADVSP